MSAERTILENGIKLGGVWRDYHERSSTLEEENARLVVENARLVEENIKVTAKHEEMTSLFSARASSLTREQSSHMAALDILQQARGDKEELEARARHSAEACVRKDGELEELRVALAASQETLTFWQTKFSGVDGLLGEEKDENEALTAIIDGRDEAIDSLKGVVAAREEDVAVLQRSLGAKDKQLQSLCRDRDRLKDRVEAARAVMAPAQRTAFDRSSTGKLLAPAPLMPKKAVTPAPSSAAASSSSASSSSSRPALANRCVNQSEGTAATTTSKAKSMSKAALGKSKPAASSGAATKTDLDALDLDLDLHDDVKGFSVRERMLRGVIRRLRDELAAAKPCTF